MDPRLQHGLIKAPCEALSKFVRNAQKLSESEVDAVLKPVHGLKRAAASLRGAADEDPKAALKASVDGTKVLKQAVQSLQGVKRKLEDLDKQTGKYASRSRARLGHLRDLEAPNSGMEWLAKERLIADFLLRSGYPQAGARLVQEEPDLAQLVDTEVFHSARQVAAQLQDGSCALAIQWCGANRARLNRADSCLEFELRLQEFVELVRGGQTRAAVEHARQHLSQAATQPEQFAVVRGAMGSLAFARSGAWGRAEPLFARSRWAHLRDLFLRELLQINGLPSRAPLEMVVRAGLYALKSPLCGQGTSLRATCPTCSGPGRQLARSLPCAHRATTLLVCRISGAPITENNPAVATPQGQVYSRAAVTGLTRPDGKFTDPSTGVEVALKDCRNVYII